MNKTLIELHIPDFDKALKFYSLLGFKKVWSEVDYLVLQFEDNILAFYGNSEKIFQHSHFKQFPKDTPRGYGVEVVIFTKHIETLYQAIQNKIEIVSTLQLKPWGKRDFRIVDPFGFYLRITESYNPLKQTPKLRSRK